jgi:hypothetical protein
MVALKAASGSTLIVILVTALATRERGDAGFDLRIISSDYLSGVLFKLVQTDDMIVPPVYTVWEVL